ncbi:flagellar biosynthesis protein FliQ [Desulfuromonas acetoxidans]|uniref:Flagellar biosynthetic protein FliQ n=1 Tax=Desulfuromonas acetoxidans (strain DSM 684 / 11070) TaxID=281689 RepID=Q1JZS3_DESA6|nr:flagellar biosynthesis protein FliQ [Desulfuromonas acetoxidans]EAT15819.1 flagellar biosynthetic protein FliQ [Desulfuromonas acetoxidans DSM 684]MBF0644979.1 flagellar biosynthesis protein FliQ [Desulfuromonas acetoxidans]NVD25636.1 flagellar biosynthesis protein FliQ [Desulfuromonas acetoxidans]NVE17688.1 flagellar biosynthesis protein FliQ [Desulfuromonas acetoxidans]
MTPEFVIDLGRNAVKTVLLISSPMLLSGLIIGLLVSIFQAATQINEQTMTFIPKIVAVLVSLILFAPWIIRLMLSFTENVFNGITLLGG